jgi:hypothetical protein
MADQTERLKTALSERYTIERELGAGGMATVQHFAAPIDPFAAPTLFVVIQAIQLGF